MRLAFSVMAFVEADGYVIDETLAFSDISFQQKCVRRLKELRKNGSTLIITSHDMQLIRGVTDRVLWLRDGKIIEDGPADSVLGHYESSIDHAARPSDSGEQE